MIACDLLSFAEFQRDKAKETVTIRFTWLDNNGYQLVGWAQSVELPYKELMDFTLGNRDKQRTWKILSIEQKNSPRFVLSVSEPASSMPEGQNNPTQADSFPAGQFQMVGR